jgi:hypothetical protein
MNRKNTKQTNGKQAKTSPKPDKAGADLQAAERELRKRYPRHNFIEGSLREAGAVPEFGQKRVITIQCSCGNKRDVATSDIFHIEFCRGCTAEHKKAVRKLRKKEKQLQSQKKAAARKSASAKQLSRKRELQPA